MVGDDDGGGDDDDDDRDVQKEEDAKEEEGELGANNYIHLRVDNCRSVDNWAKPVIALAV